MPQAPDLSYLDNHLLQSQSILTLRDEMNSYWRQRNTDWKNNTFEERQRLANANPEMYNFYRVMLKRVYDTTHFQYRLWGAKGAEVKESWRYNNLTGWNNFCIDLGVLPYRSYHLDMRDDTLSMDESGVYWKARYSITDGLSNDEHNNIEKDNEFREKSNNLIQFNGEVYDT